MLCFLASSDSPKHTLANQSRNPITPDLVAHRRLAVTVITFNPDKISSLNLVPGAHRRVWSSQPQWNLMSTP